MLLRSSHSCMNCASWLRLGLGVTSKKGGSISRSAYCQARKKLKGSLFDEIDDGLIARYYAEQKRVARWKGLRLMSMDGSSLITNEPIYCNFIDEMSEEDYEDMQDNHMHTYSDETQLHCVSLHDVLNDLCLGFEVDFKSVGERELAARLSRIIRKDMLIIFDRGYPAGWFFRLMQRIGCKFLIRLKKDHSKDVGVFYESGKEESTLQLKLDGEDVQKLKSCGYRSRTGAGFQVRLVRCEHESSIRLFATNLSIEEASAAEIGDLYRLRWEIEKSYGTFKTYLKLEGWTQYSKEGVLTDIAIKRLLYNLSSMMSQGAHIKLLRELREYELKKPESIWEFKLVKVYAVNLLKDEFDAFYRLRTDVRDSRLRQLLCNYSLDLQRNPSWIVKGRKVERKNKSKPNRKTQMNRKTGT